MWSCSLAGLLRLTVRRFTGQSSLQCAPRAACTALFHADLDLSENRISNGKPSSTAGRYFGRYGSKRIDRDLSGFRQVQLVAYRSTVSSGTISPVIRGVYHHPSSIPASGANCLSSLLSRAQ